MVTEYMVWLPVGYIVAARMVMPAAGCTVAVCTAAAYTLMLAAGHTVAAYTLTLAAVHTVAEPVIVAVLSDRCNLAAPAVEQAVSVPAAVAV